VKAVSTQRARLVEELVHRHQDAVRGFLRYLGCPASLVDDLTQDAFLSFLSARFEDRGEAATAAYLRKIARNLFLKSLRKEGRAPQLEDLDGAERAWVRFEGDDGGDSYLDALRLCLDSVEGRAREVIVMRYRSNLRREAIAGRLEISESGVKSILVRTRKRLRECVERRLER
jgi:RNA polymerase sigma-70 factor (ECF subfamily)